MSVMESQVVCSRMVGGLLHNGPIIDRAVEEVFRAMARHLFQPNMPARGSIGKKTRKLW
jgi:hypothetical protein